MSKTTIATKPKTGKPIPAFSVVVRNGKWLGRFRLANGSRPGITLGDVAGPGRLSKARAEEKLASLLERGLAEKLAEVAEHKAARAKTVQGATVRELGEAWTSGSLYAQHGAINGLTKKLSAYTDKKRFERHVYPLIGDMNVADVTDRDVERVFAHLPEESSAGTRRHYHSLHSMLFRLAEYPARLRPENTNPVRRYMLPAREPSKLFSYLLPDEVLALLRCPAVPLGRKVAYALGCYSGCEKARYSRCAGVISTRDTGCSPCFEVSAGLTWVLERWRATVGGRDEDTIVGGLDAPVGREAATLRADLQAAGVTRSVLFADDPRVEPIRFHDLRATFVTWGKRAGYGDGWISDRTATSPAKCLSATLVLPAP